MKNLICILLALPLIALAQSEQELDLINESPLQEQKQREQQQPEEDTLGSWEAAEPSPVLEENIEALEEGITLDPNEPPINWVDNSHAVITNQA